jgi:DNA-binding XRE family transcriptional regulator
MNNNIRKIRNELNITQEELAKKAKLSRYLILKLEKGEDVNITKNTMISIATALEKKVTDIFFF